MRTSRADKNRLSVSLDTAGEPCYVIWEQYPRPLRELAGNLVSFGQPGEAWDSLLKFSGGISGQTFNFVAAAQGAESAVDFNHVSMILFDGEVVLGSSDVAGECVCKIKGGTFNLKAEYRVLIMSQPSRKADIIVGEWSDQSTGACFGLVPFLAKFEKVNGERPTISIGRVSWSEFKAIRKLPNLRVLYLRSLCEVLYWWGKFALVKSGLWALGLKIQAKFSKKTAQ